MNKWKESELVRSLLGFFLLFLLFVGLFIFVVPSTHQSSKIAEKIKSIKNEKVTYVAIGDSLTQGVGDSSNQGGFVPVNDLLYKGIDGKGGVTSSDDSSQSSKSSQDSLNDALFEDDHFHPNNTGYQIMSDAILKRINQTKKEWSGE